MVLKTLKRDISVDSNLNKLDGLLMDCWSQ